MCKKFGHHCYREDQIAKIKYEHLKNQMQLRTLTNALARTVCVAANFFNLTSDEVFFTTGPHLITPVHVGGKLVKGFFKNIRKKIKKSPQKNQKNTQKNP